MKKTIQLLGITLFGVAVLAACGDDSVSGGGPTGGSGDGGNPPEGGNPPDGGNGGGPQGGNGGGPPAFPPPPELGAQIDRMGRPAINTALNGAFVQFDGANPVPADAVARGMLQDGYNEDSTEADWGDTYTTMFIANLAALDSVDTGLDLDGIAGPNPPLTNAQACVNQFGSMGDLKAPTNYGALGSLVLPDDRVYVNVGGQNCSALPPASPLEGYLGVELNAQGGPLVNTGCGGRRPVDDTIQTTYSALAVGLLAGFDDGITARADQHPEAFPYMAAPQ